MMAYLARGNRNVLNCARGLRHISNTTRPHLAFAFDIDGVLLRGSSVIPGAKQALSILEGDNPINRKIPYVLLTNGGGVSEAERCHKLTKQLGIDIRPSMLVQAHTILREHSKDFADRNVLVLGGKKNDLRQVAESYGFKNVWTPLDVKAWNPHVWPLYDLTSEDLDTVQAADFSSERISAVFVFHDPRNWALDIQILLDIIQSRGYVGKPYTYDGKGAPPIQLVFCNPDLLWKSEFPVSRLGQGAFRDAFQAVYKSITGVHYPAVQYGKPTKSTYDFARRVLRERMDELGIQSSSAPLSTYMIGDNPESDIAGANNAGWDSVLVRTGVYEELRGPPMHKPTHIADTVLEGVQWALRREWKIRAAES